MVRTQDAFHSALLMCVAGSQNAMQSARDLPPPPGWLGAASAGLVDWDVAEGVPGDRARVLVVLPPVANCVGSWGDKGATGASSGSGAASVGEGMVSAGTLSGAGNTVTAAAAANALLRAEAVAGAVFDPACRPDGAEMPCGFGAIMPVTCGLPCAPPWARAGKETRAKTVAVVATVATARSVRDELGMAAPVVAGSAPPR